MGIGSKQIGITQSGFVVHNVLKQIRTLDFPIANSAKDIIAFQFSHNTLFGGFTNTHKVNNINEVIAG